MGRPTSRRDGGGAASGTGSDRGSRHDHTAIHPAAATRGPGAVNPWLTLAAQLDDTELAAWLADVRIVLADAAGDDPASRSTREVAELMRAAVERELALRRRAGARKHLPPGGLPREQSRRLREEIRQRLDLVALVQQDVPDLRRSGSSWRGRCPLHNGDNRQSLTVWPDRGRWRCWSCGMGGDAVAWLMATRPQLDFRAALMHAVMLAGMPPGAAVAWPRESRRRNRREPDVRIEGGKVVAP